MNWMVKSVLIEPEAVEEEDDAHTLASLRFRAIVSLHERFAKMPGVYGGATKEGPFIEHYGPSMQEALSGAMKKLGNVVTCMWLAEQPSAPAPARWGRAESLDGGPIVASGSSGGDDKARVTSNAALSIRFGDAPGATTRNLGDDWTEIAAAGETPRAQLRIRNIGSRPIDVRGPYDVTIQPSLGVFTGETVLPADYIGAVLARATPRQDGLRTTDAGVPFSIPRDGESQAELSQLAREGLPVVAIRWDQQKSPWLVRLSTIGGWRSLVERLHTELCIENHSTEAQVQLEAAAAGSSFHTVLAPGEFLELPADPARTVQARLAQLPEGLTKKEG